MNHDRAIDRGLAAGAGLAFFGLAWHHMAIAGDGFWMIASGRWVLSHWGVPHHDPFAFSSTGDWTLVSTGSCVLFGVLANAVGLRGLMVFGAALEALAVWILWARAARTRRARLAVLPLALFFIQVDADDLSCRGQLFGDLAFVLLLGALARLRDGKTVHPAFVVAGVAAWTNVHVSFLSAIVVPLAVAAFMLLEPAATRPPLRRFATVAGLAAVAVLANPYGPRYVPFVLGLAFDSSNRTFDLFQSPNLHDPSWLAAPAAGCLLVLAREYSGSATMRRPEQAFLVAFVAAACFSRRFATQLVAIDIGVLGAMLDGGSPSEPARTTGALARAALAEAMLAGLLGIYWLSERKDPLRDVPARAAELARPLERVQRATEPARARVVNPLHWGGYLAYAWMGDPRYFIDGRDQVFLFGNGAFEDQAALWNGAPNALALLDVYEAGTVIWERGAPLDSILRHAVGWNLVHEDRIAVLYERRP